MSDDLGDTGSIVMPMPKASHPYDPDLAEPLAQLLARPTPDATLARFFPLARDLAGISLEEMENGMFRLARTGGNNVLMLKKEAPLNQPMADTLLHFLLPRQLHPEIKPALANPQAIFHLLTVEI